MTTSVIRVVRASAVAASLAVACSHAVPTPNTGPHVREDAVTVPFPPPPAKVEIIPNIPKGMENGVWVDGSWEWRGHRWMWTAGKWESPLPDTYYALPTTVRMADGSLAYFAGAWRSTVVDPSPESTTKPMATAAPAEPSAEPLAPPSAMPSALPAALPSASPPSAAPTATGSGR